MNFWSWYIKVLYDLSVLKDLMPPGDIEVSRRRPIFRYQGGKTAGIKLTYRWWPSSQLNYISKNRKTKPASNYNACTKTSILIGSYSYKSIKWLFLKNLCHKYELRDLKGLSECCYLWAIQEYLLSFEKFA